MTDYLKAIRGCNGGESVHNGKTESACDYCEAGRCRQIQLCETLVPEPTEAERNRDAWRKARIAAIQTPFD